MTYKGSGVNMKYDFLESSEYYHIKYSNFSTKIIIPIFLFFLLVIAILCVTPKVVQVNSIGTIIPNEEESIVEIHQDKIIKKITDNNQTIEKGEVIVTYDDGETVSAPSSGILSYSEQENSPSQLSILPFQGSNLTVVTSVNQQDIGEISKDQKVSFRYGDELLSGKVVRKSPTATIDGDHIGFEVYIDIISSNENEEIYRPYFSVGEVYIQTDKTSYIKYIIDSIFL